MKTFPYPAFDPRVVYSLGQTANVSTYGMKQNRKQNETVPRGLHLIPKCKKGRGNFMAKQQLVTIGNGLLTLRQ